MKKTTLRLSILAIFMALTSSIAFSQAVNTSITAQTGVFTVSMDITPSHAPMDAGVGLSSGEVAGWSDMSSIVGTHSSGYFQARNGDHYEKIVKEKYEANMTYTLMMTIDVPNETYSAKVIPSGGTEFTIAYNFGFRASATTLDNLFSFNNDLEAWGGVPGATLDITNFNIADSVATSVNYCIEPSIYQNFTIAPQQSIFVCEFDVTTIEDSIDCAVALNNSPSFINPAWGDMSTIVRFNSASIVDVRNGGSYETLYPNYKYKENETFHFKMEVNVLMNTYDVYVTDDTATSLIADDYAFRNTTDELNYRVIASVSGDQTLMDVQNFSIVDAYQSASVLYAQTLPVIDGDLSDGYWDAIEENVNETPVRAMDTVTVDIQSRATWKGVWSEDSLFVMVHVYDETPYDGSTKLWTNDGVHLYFGVENKRNGAGGKANATSDPADVAKTFGQYYWKADGSQSFGGEIHPDNGMNYTIVTNDTGYVFEAAIPVKALNRHGSTFAPVGDGKILFDVDVIDHNGTSNNELQWSSYQNNWGNMNNAGEMSFVKTLDYALLTTVIDSSKTVVAAAVVGLASDEYRQAAIDAANVAIAAAEADNGVLGTQTEIDASVATLRAAMKLFMPNGIDYTALSTVIDSCQTVIDAAVVGEANGEYTQTAVNAANLAVYNAEQVLAGAASQAEVDQAISDLRAAMSLFVAISGVSVEDLFGASISMYPNPVEDIMYINNIAGVKTVSIYDAAGKVVSIYSNTNESMLVNLANLTEGLYIIKFVSEDNVGTKRFIKK